jgi:hypothetical protein
VPALCLSSTVQLTVMTAAAGAVAWAADFEGEKDGNNSHGILHYEN